MAPESGTTVWVRAEPEPRPPGLWAGPERPVRHRHHRRRWPWVVGGVLLVLAVGTGVVWLTTNRAKPVTLREAESRLGAAGTKVPAGTRPAAGVYDYTGSGSEKLSLPPLSQGEGPTIPGTVTLQGQNCFLFRVDYSTHHWQTWRYCLHNGDVWEAGGQSWIMWSIGPLNVTNLSSFTCVAGTMAVPTAARPGESWHSSCTGTNTSVKGRTVSAGPYRFEGLATLRIGGVPVRAAHFLRLRTDSGAQKGTERSDVWFDLSTGLPLRVQQVLKVTSSTPFGSSTFTQTGVFSLASTAVHR
jgi:hypothetical protein